MSARLTRIGATVVSAAAAALIASTGLAAEPPAAPRADAYVLFSAGSQGAEMSGSMADVARAKALRADGESLLYVRQGGAAYVVRDAATLRKAKALFEPQEALGARQAELGARQAALGRQQARLGAEQAALSRRQVSSSPGGDEDLAVQQKAIGRQQALLGERQAALGRDQDELGREQGRIGRIAEQQMQLLLADAIRSGLAQRVD